MTADSPRDRRGLRIARLLVSAIVIVLVFAYMFREISANWSELSRIEWRENIDLIVLHFVVLLAMQSIMGLAWYRILLVHQAKLDFKSLVYCFYVPNFGKYVPGKILFLAGRIELTNRLGANRAIAASAFILESLFLVFAAAMLVLPCLLTVFETSPEVLVASYSVLLLVVGVITFFPRTLFNLINRFLKRIKQAPIVVAATSRTFVSLLVNYLAVWLTYGISGTLLAVALGLASWADFYTVASAFVTAWLLGFLSFLNPGGLGVREGVLVILLQPIMDSTSAMLLAIIARLSWTVAELGISSVALFLPIKQKKQ